MKLPIKKTDQPSINATLQNYIGDDDIDIEMCALALLKVIEINGEGHLATVLADILSNFEVNYKKMLQEGFTIKIDEKVKLRFYSSTLYLCYTDLNKSQWRCEWSKSTEPENELSEVVFFFQINVETNSLLEHSYFKDGVKISLS